MAQSEARKRRWTAWFSCEVRTLLISCFSFSLGCAAGKEWCQSTSDHIEACTCGREAEGWLCCDRIILTTACVFFPLLRGNGAEATEVTESVCGDQRTKTCTHMHMYTVWITSLCNWYAHHLKHTHLLKNCTFRKNALDCHNHKCCWMINCLRNYWAKR